MPNHAADPPPYTLWFETLPSDDTAQLLIRPCATGASAVLEWNGQTHTERRFSTRAAAERWGHEFRHVLLRDALAGALLGYDKDVIARLQAQCSGS